jgi:hypothetical protein
MMDERSSSREFVAPLFILARSSVARTLFANKFPGGTMDKRRLLLGSAVLLVLAGLLLAALTPGGWFNSGTTQAVDTPIGSIRIQEKKSSNWPTLGYILLGVGGAGLVFVFAMKSPPRI